MGILNHSQNKGNGQPISRNVIQDLLPLYLAGEASADTVALVEKYLETDLQMAELAKEMSKTDLSEIQVPLSKEAEMEAYKQANQRMLMRSLILALFVGMFMCMLLALGAFLVITNII